MTKVEQEFLERVAGILEVPSVAPETDFRAGPLWDSLTAFALRGTELSPGAHSAVGCVLLVPAIVAIALLAHLMSGRSK